MRDHPSIDGFAQPTARIVGMDLASGPDQTAVMRGGVIRLFPREPRTSDELERSLSPAAQAEFARFRAS